MTTVILTALLAVLVAAKARNLYRRIDILEEKLVESQTHLAKAVGKLTAFVEGNLGRNCSQSIATNNALMCMLGVAQYDILLFKQEMVDNEDYEEVAGVMTLLESVQNMITLYTQWNEEQNK